MAVKRKYRLNLRNYGNLPAIMLSQYDEGYALEFEIRDGTDAASDLSAYTVTLKGTRVLLIRGISLTALRSSR